MSSLIHCSVLRGFPQQVYPAVCTLVLLVPALLHSAALSEVSACLLVDLSTCLPRSRIPGLQAQLPEMMLDHLSQCWGSSGFPLAGCELRSLHSAFHLPFGWLTIQLQGICWFVFGDAEDGNQGLTRNRQMLYH
jgi:hypothetical protein